MTVRTLLDAVIRDVRDEREEIHGDADHLKVAVEWLYCSQNVTDCGGSAAAYNLVLGWQDAFPETTGYIVPTLYDVNEYTASDEPARRADRMARWLLTVQRRDGAFPGHPPLWGSAEPKVFDTGQIVFGLLRQYEETGERRYADATHRACDWLVRHQNDDGAWRAHSYNEIAHVYTTRVAWALAAAGVAFDDHTYRRAARNTLEWAVTCRRKNGWFEECGFDSGSDPFLHTIAYTVRGLIEGGILLNSERIVEAGQDTAIRLARFQKEGGILAGRYDRNWEGANFYCLTGNAQMATVWLRLYERTGETLYYDAAVDAIEFLKSTHRLNGPDGIRGGIKGSHPVWERYMYLRYPNWAAKFFVDALLLRLDTDVDTETGHA